MTKFKKWQLLRSQLVFNHQWCQIRRDTIKLANGEIIDDFFVNIRPDIALIFPVTPAAEVKSRIVKGEICVSGTVAAIFLGLDFLSHIVSD